MPRGNMDDVGYANMILTVVTMFAGLFAIVAMSGKNGKGSVLNGMLISSLLFPVTFFLTV